jgi:hypothetical protein
MYGIYVLQTGEEVAIDQNKQALNQRSIANYVFSYPIGFPFFRI